MLELVKDSIKLVPDFPKKGILFRDISGILENPKAMKELFLELGYLMNNIDVVVGLESRGFIFGVYAALIEDKPFVMCRKKGKLPGDCYQQSYSLEYGEATIEIQKDAPIKGNVLIVDDLLATGGTMAAAVSLVKKFNPTSIKTLNIVEIRDEGLKGREYLQSVHPDCEHNVIING